MGTQPCDVRASVVCLVLLLWLGGSERTRLLLAGWDVLWGKYFGPMRVCASHQRVLTELRCCVGLGGHDCS